MTVPPIVVEPRTFIKLYSTFECGLKTNDVVRSQSTYSITESRLKVIASGRDSLV